MLTVTYSSNNSGGGWWLTDEDWKALEEAGWKVEWYANEDTNSFMKPDKDGRWLGALATRATVERETLQEAVEEFERLTGQDASDQGCNCCGPPHSFSAEDEEGNYHYADIAVETRLRYY